MSIDFLNCLIVLITILALLFIILWKLKHVLEKLRILIIKSPLESHQCFTCKRHVNIVYAVFYKGLLQWLCPACHGHYWVETHRHKKTPDEAISYLSSVYKEVRKK